MDIHRKERIFFNWSLTDAVKTSLFRTLLGMHFRTKGRPQFGADIETGYYDQIRRITWSTNCAWWSGGDRYALYDTDSASGLDTHYGDDVFKPISALSGVNALVLFWFNAFKSKFLMLDEPTNHLDIQSCEALESALQSHEGIAHHLYDRYFINKMAKTKFYARLRQTELSTILRDYDFIWEHQFRFGKKQGNHHTQKSNDYKPQQRTKEFWTPQKELLKTLQKKIDQLEQKLQN